MLALVLVFLLTNNIKNQVLEVKIEHIKKEQVASKSTRETYALNKRLEMLSFLQAYPRGIFQEMINYRQLQTEMQIIDADISVELEKMNAKINEIKLAKDKLQHEVNQKQESFIDTAMYNQQANYFSEQQSKIKEETALIVEKMNMDHEFLNNKKVQLPVLFFFAGIWISVFGALTIALV